MSKVCQYSGKRPRVGRKAIRKGKPKREGGIGTHITGAAKRRWKPNLQTVRVVDEHGTVKKVRVAARYLKAGKFKKAPRGMQAAKAAKAKAEAKA
jgi:large subunit ribosomal protein L28